MEDIYTLEIDGKQYLIIDQIKDKDNEFVYFSNEEDPKDFCIRKLASDDNDTLVGLDSDEEFDYALGLFLDKHKDII